MPTTLAETLILTTASSTKTRIPAFVYGTAWKKERTADLVYQALKAGFTGIDVAAQPKHYREDLVGVALRKALKDGIVRREELFLQTKFTSVAGQDIKNMPYDPSLPVSAQVHASVASSLKNLEYPSTMESYIDCVVLHSPLRTIADTITAWRTLEEYVPSRIRNLGISNTTLSVLQALYTSPEITIKPSVVQNRFYAETGFDGPIRKFCRDKGIIYQTFWTLTANPRLLRSAPVSQLAKQAGVEPPVSLYSLIMGLENMVCLNGTTNSETMVDDLGGLDSVRDWTSKNQTAWQELLAQFKNLIGET